MPWLFAGSVDVRFRGHDQVKQEANMYIVTPACAGMTGRKIRIEKRVSVNPSRRAGWR